MHTAENQTGHFSQMRMHLQPPVCIFTNILNYLFESRFFLKPPFPINYATAAIPTLAPFGTEYTPEQYIKIVGGRTINIPVSHSSMPNLTTKASTQKP